MRVKGAYTALHIMTQMKRTMKTLLITIIGLMPFVAGAQLPQTTLTSSGTTETPQPMYPAPAIPRGQWYMIRADYLPSTPPGWVVVNMVPILQNGTTMGGVQMFLHNQYTGQNAVWGVGL